MATFTFDGSASQTINFNVAVDRIIFDLNAEDLASISEDRSTNTVTIVSTTGAILTLTNTNLAAIRAGETTGMNNFVPGLDSDITFDIGTRAATADTLTGNVVVALEGPDLVTGSSTEGNRPGALLFGNTGDDVITNGNSFSVRAFGGQGNDRIVLGTTNASDSSLLVGGLGGDTIIVGGTASGVASTTVTTTGAYAGDVTIFGGNEAGDPTDGIDNITATLTSGGSALVYGNGGNDVITINGVAAAGPVAATAGTATVFGGQGNDQITASVEGGLFVGGLGTDTIDITSFGPEGADFTVFGGNGAADATDGRDVITLTLQDNDTALVYGNGGNDSIILDGEVNSHVTVFGGQGNDTIGGATTGFIGEGSLVYGGLGSDAITVTLVNNDADATAGIAEVGSSATIYGGNGLADAADGNDVISVTLAGDSRSSTTSGQSQFAEVYGNGGNDQITLLGQGSAIVFGGQGNDTISVGDGVYTLNGGAGEDRFSFDTTVTGGTNGVNGGAAVDATTVAADITYIADLNFDQDELDLGVNVTSVINTSANATTGSTLSAAATTAFNQATSQLGAAVEAAVIFTYQGEQYLVQAAVEVASGGAGTGPGTISASDIDTLIRVTGFTGTADASDFVVA